MDSEDDTPPGQHARKAAGEGAGTSAGNKKAKAGGSRKGDVAEKKVGKGVSAKKAPKGGQPAGAGGSRGAGRQEAPSDTESDEDTMPIAKRAKLVSQDSVLKSGMPVGKPGEAAGRASSGGGEEETPVVRLAKLPAGLEKAMAARAAEKGDKVGGEGGRAGKEGGAGGAAYTGGESEATVVELGETDGGETEESSPVTKTSTVNKLSRRKPAKGKEMLPLDAGLASLLTIVAFVVPLLRHRRDSQSAILKLFIPSRCSGEGGQWGDQAASAAGRVCSGAPFQGRPDDPARCGHGSDQERPEDDVRLCAAVRPQPGQTRRRNGHAQQETPHAGGQAGEGKIHRRKRAAGERPHMEVQAALQEGGEATYCASIGCSVLVIHVVKAVQCT
jgi:hypothetical protein